MSTQLSLFDVQLQIEQYRDRVSEALEYVKDMKIETRENVDMALNMAVEAINLNENIEATRKSIIEPSRRFQAEVNSLAKDFTEKLGDMKSTIVSTIEDWKTRNEEVGELGTPKVAVVESSEFEYEVEDYDAVPRQFLTVDEDRVKLAMKKGMRAIPGIKINTKKKLTLRRR